MRHNDANKMTLHLTPCYMYHSQNFNKIDSFLKSVLNICIFGDLIVGWGEQVIEEGVGILHRIYSCSARVNIWGNRIRQSKSWYYLGSSQTSKVDFFAEIVWLKAINIFCKKLQLRCLTGPIRRFPKKC